MKAYKYRHDIKLHIEQTSNLNKIYAPLSLQLNDPQELQIDDRCFWDFLKLNDSKATQDFIKEYNELLDFFKKRIGIFSLSKSLQNYSLWGNYANSHKGFCIEYDIDYLKECDNRLNSKKIIDSIEVAYNHSLPKLDNNKFKKLIEDKKQLIKFIFGNKLNDWRNEEEVRILYHNFGIHNIGPKAVTGIYFGCNMPKTDKIKIMQLLKDRDLKFYEMYIEKNVSELKYKEVVPETFLS